MPLVFKLFGAGVAQQPLPRIQPPAFLGSRGASSRAPYCTAGSIIRHAIQSQRDLLPYSAFTSFRTAFEEPNVEEGFSEVRKVNWVFEGDEDARRRWSMWLQIDGK